MIHIDLGILLLANADIMLVVGQILSKPNFHWSLNISTLAAAARFQQPLSKVRNILVFGSWHTPNVPSNLLVKTHTRNLLPFKDM